jgi:hypothetical protein
VNVARTAEEILALIGSNIIGPATGHAPIVPIGGDAAFSFNPKASGSSGGSPSGYHQPLWQTALHTLNATSKPLTSLTNAWSDGKLRANDIPFINALQLGLRAGKGQLDAWNDGTGDARDIPIIGSMASAGANEPGFDQTLKNFGVKNDAALKWGGLAGDILFDPLTFLTFGAGSAMKAGARAAGKVALEEAGKAGVKAATKGKNLTNIAGNTAVNIFEKLKNDLIAKGINPDLAERFAVKKGFAARDAIEGAGKAARGQAQNALINLDIPFTKITKQFGTKPGFLMKNPAKIGLTGAASAADILANIGAKTDVEQKAILKKMGIEVNDLKDMNVQEFAHLQEQSKVAQDYINKFRGNDGNLKNNLRDFNVEDQVIGHNQFVNYHPFQAEDFLSQLDPRVADRLAPFVKSLENDIPALRNLGPEAMRTFGAALGKLPGTIKGKTADAIRTAIDDAATKIGDVSHTAEIVDQPILGQKITGEVAKDFSLPKTLDQFIQDMGGRSKLGDQIGKVTDVFNPRTLGVAGEGIVNHAAEQIQNAENVKRVGMREAEHVVADLKKATKDFSEEENKQVAYLLENKFPDNYNVAISDRAQAVANKLRPIYQKIASEESKRGILQGVLPNYAPHVIKNLSQDALDRAAEYAKKDESFARLVAKGTSSKFSKERKSFDSFAELDNALNKLDDAAKKTTDPEALAEINDKIDILSNLFERDPIDALGKRYTKSIKVRAMKDLQDGLRKNGLIRDTISNTPEAARVKGQFHQLTKEEAGALNLKPGTLIHKEVFDAMKKTDQVFTDKGFQKFLTLAENVTSIIRSVYTTYVPSHYMNNFTGNLFNNALAGVSSKNYVDAGKLMIAMKRGKATAEQQKVWDQALETGVLHQGNPTEYLKSGQAKGGTAKVAHFMYNNKVAKGMRRILGEPADNVTRLALFMKGLETGSTKHASDLVRKHLFNYHEMTTGDRVMRTIVPFWNWMKNNVPLQIEKLAQQPRFYSTYERIKRANQGDNSDMPGYSVPSYFKVLGKGRDPMLPLNDLNEVLSGSVPETLRYGLSSLNPMFKVPTEVATNKSLYTGKPIDYEREYKGGFDPGAWAKYALGNIGGKYGRTAYDVGSGETSILDAIGQLLSPFGKPINLGQ